MAALTRLHDKVFRTEDSKEGPRALPRSASHSGKDGKGDKLWRERKPRDGEYHQFERTLQRYEIVPATRKKTMGRNDKADRGALIARLGRPRSPVKISPGAHGHPIANGKSRRSSEAEYDLGRGEYMV